jgi:hypothetical protein
MHRTTPRLSLAFAFASVLALSGLLCPRPAAAQAETSNTNVKTRDFAFGDFVPCANNGEGEVVVVTGTMHDIIHFAVNDNHAAIDTFVSFHGTGVGLTSGDTYRINDAGHSTVNFQLDGFTDTETFVTNHNVIGQGTAPNFRLRQLTHITINNNGEFTAEHVDFQFECR